MKTSAKIRAQAAKQLAPVLANKSSLKLSAETAPLLREMCFGTLREYNRLSLILKQFINKPFKTKDKDIEALILIGLYQLKVMRTPDHAVLNETVQAAMMLKKKWAKGIVNATLRSFLREPPNEEGLEENEAYLYCHPKWLVDAIKQDWPENFESIFSAGNQKPPMCLRVNSLKRTRNSYIKELQDLDLHAQPTEHSNCGIQLDKPISINQLPGFFEGLCSVQDQAAQLCSELLDLHPGFRVLDSCAAPGGKTCHLLETEPFIKLTSMDISKERLESVSSNLGRLNLKANLIATDAADTKAWWNGERFDRILLDAPCSGTGVIRRHPDIKLLRTKSDLQSFHEQQHRLLTNLWPLLKEDGLLLYVTCSIMRWENEVQIGNFVKNNPSATIEVIETDWGKKMPHGIQLLPTDSHDGFFYSLLRKTASEIAPT